MYQIGTGVRIVATGANGIIVGAEVADDGSFTYRVKYTQPDGNVVREWYAATQLSI
jgi:hypothetical protein